MSHTSLRVMVVEDQFLIAKQIELILSSIGHEVIGIADSLDGALDLAASSRPDLSMVDLSLADGVTGPLIAKHIVEKRQGAVLFTTANVRRLPQDYCGAIGSIEKPFTKAGLVAAITYLQPHLAGADAAGAKSALTKPTSLRLSPVFDALWAPRPATAPWASAGQPA